ncbi:hypothetical protein D3C71_1791300 [compost metagenome]
MPSCVAVLTATGAISTAVAVLEMNRPITAVTANRQARMALGPAPPSTLTRPPTARSMPPVFCSAWAKGSMPTISTRLCQWMAR